MQAGEALHRKERWQFEGNRRVVSWIAARQLEIRGFIEAIDPNAAVRTYIMTDDGRAALASHRDCQV